MILGGIVGIQIAIPQNQTHLVIFYYKLKVYLTVGENMS